MIKVLLAVPTFENISPETFKSIYDLIIPDDVMVRFKYVRGYDCAVARNKIAEVALKGNYDYVFMVDSDVVLPDKALVNLLEGQSNIVMGYYPRKKNSSKSEVFNKKFEHFIDNGRYSMKDLKLSPENRLEVKGGGFGCTLIKTDVLKHMAYPYFQYVIRDQPNNLLSEDLYFCYVATKIGYTIFVDTRVACKHISKQIVS